MEKNAAKVCIPAMTIQTLAENAVKHGITAVRDLGLISVSAELIASRELGNRVIITVSDNGPGFQDGAAAAVRFGSGYGLRHIRERLSAHYGQAAALRIRRDQTSETTFVSLEVPAVLDGGESCES
jgi:LytS/YehU family sensor histidine kinase